MTTPRSSAVEFSSPSPRLKEVGGGAIACWHCGSLDGSPRTCECIVCEGKCKACVGRVRIAKELDLAARLRLDVQDSTNYRVHHDGPKQSKVLKLPAGVAA